MSLVCKGQAERRINLRGGLFILTLPTACRINGHGWTMTGLARRSVQSTVSLPVVAIKPFRLSTTITQRSVERHLNSPHWEILSKIENIKISSLDVDPNEDSGIIWGLNTHSTIWTTMYSHPCNWHNTNDRDELSEIPTTAPTTTRRWKGVVIRRVCLAVRSNSSIVTCKHRKGSPQCETWEANCGSRRAREKNKVDHRRPTAIYEVALISFSARMPNNGFARRPLKRDSEH